MTALEGAAPTAAVHWLKSWDDRPIRAPACCSHPGPAALSINLRLEARPRGGRTIVKDGSLCMDCGTDSSGVLSLRDGLARAFTEHGWETRTGDRLFALARLHEDALWASGESLPVWMAHAWGWSGDQILATMVAAEGLR